MSLEVEVAGVLRKAPVQRVSFSLANIRVNKAQMELVAKAIIDGRILVPIGNLDSRLSAAYSTRREPKGVIGEIRIRNAEVLKNALGRAGILHESVHALQMDVKPQKISIRNGDEALAYIADALYVKAARGTISTTDNPIYAAAFALIEKRKMLVTPGVALNWDDCQDLLDAINQNGFY